MSKIIYYLNFLFLFASIFFLAFDFIYFREVKRTENQLGIFIPAGAKKGFKIYIFFPAIIFLLSIIFIIKGM